MRFFPFIYAFIYTMMHVYAVYRAKSAFKFKTKIFILLMLFSIIMVIIPIIIRMSHLSDFHLLKQEMTYYSFLWMGFIVLLCSNLLIYDICRLLLNGCRRLLQKDLSKFILPGSYGFITCLFMSIMLLIYGHFEAQNIVTEKITIYTKKLPESVNKLTIVQISDVHLGHIVREKRLDKIIEKVVKSEPDILVATGDIVDGQINHNLELIEPFNRFNPKYGKYAVAGNHEFYVGIDQAVDFMQKAGFKVLRGEWVSTAGMINIAGVDDPIAANFSSTKAISEKELLLSLPRDKFTILLKHRPDVKPDSLGLFDLQLSGHTHKGQLIPFNLITKLYYPVHAGYAKLPNNSSLYVNRGAGTTAPPIRILSPPEITIIELVRTP